MFVVDDNVPPRRDDKVDIDCLMKTDSQKKKKEKKNEIQSMQGSYLSRFVIKSITSVVS